MRVIESNGGPIIGLHREAVSHWLGIDGRGFVDSASQFNNDYEAACAVVHGRTRPPCNGAILEGPNGHAIVFSRSLETAVIMSDGNAAYLAQVEYSDPDWSFSNIRIEDFDKAVFQHGISEALRLNSGNIVLFDSAYPGGEIGDDSIEFSLNDGIYRVDSALYHPDDSTALILFKIIK